MLKTCSRCGKLHNISQQCPMKPKYKKRLTRIDNFRSSKEWQLKRGSIKERDKSLCQICIRSLYNTIERQYNFNCVQVHHIKSIKTNWKKRLEDSNLLCLCPYHHKMAEDGGIHKDILLSIAQEQINSNTPPVFL